jgi:two-component system, NtrC family, response regulator AtoC
LRQRREEIPLLTEYFIQKYSEHYNRPALTPERDTQRLLLEYGWPGNIRELENMVKRMVVLGTDASIRQEIAQALAHRPYAVGPIPVLAGAAVASPVPAASAGATGAALPSPAAAEAAVNEPPAPCSLKAIARHAAREAERHLIARTLQYTHWNRREAAEILGISYKALLYKIKEAELDRVS